MRIRPRNRALGLALSVALAASTVALATPQAASAAEATVTSAEVTYTFVVGDIDPSVVGDRVVLDVGHTDAIAPAFEDGELVIRTKDDTQLHAPGIVYRDPADVIFQVEPTAEVTVPDNANFSFLGDPGDIVWMLPMTQDPSLLWPGWSTEHASLAGEFASIDYAITDVAGPGDFHLFLNGPFGGPLHRANSLGTLPNTWTEPVPAHVHANWAFTAPGTYSITFQVEGTWLNAPDPVGTSLSITGAEDHVHAGDTVTLTAVQDPPTGEDHYHWFVKPAGASDFTVVNGALAGTYSFTAEEPHDGAQYLVRLYDHDHAVIAESAPVTVHVEDHGEEPVLSQTITATLEESEGALVVSVDPDDRHVTMDPFALSGDGSRWEADGELRPVVITDTRSGQPGWSVSGQASEFTSGAAVVGSQHLGWLPTLASQSPDQGATPGSQVAPGAGAGEGLSVSRTLASAPTGDGLGTATAGGELDLHLPTSAATGTYTAVLTLTAI